MKYGSVKDLPVDISELPSAAQEIYLAAFNSAETSDKKAHETAMATVKVSFKQENGKWVKTGDAVEDQITHAVFIEPLQLNDSDVHFTQDGYLVAAPRIARTGIQVYRGFEVGRPQMDTVRVYRPEDEVFHVDSLSSWAHRPVTNDHPIEKVTSKNWSKVAKGQTDGDVARDGQFIRVPMIVMDQETIDAWKKGKKQLSGGYRADLVWGEGKSPDGEKYDAVQRTIRGNHVAIVNGARGGPMLTIGDSFASFADGRQDDPPKQRRKWMAGEDTRVITVDGVPSEMTSTSASVVLRALDQRDAKIKEQTDAIAKLTSDAAAVKIASDTAATTAKADADKLTGENAALKKQVEDAKMTPDKLDALVRDRVDICTRAVRILGDQFDPKGKTDVDIMRATCDAKLGAEATKALNDDAVKGAFNALTVGTGTPGTSGVHDTARAFSSNNGGGIHSPQAAAKAAWEKSTKDAQDSWKSPQQK